MLYDFIYVGFAGLGQYTRMLPMLEGQIVVFVVSNIQFTRQPPWLLVSIPPFLARHPTCRRGAESSRITRRFSMGALVSRNHGGNRWPQPETLAMRSYAQLGVRSMWYIQPKSSGPKHGEKRKLLGTRQPDWIQVDWSFGGPKTYHPGRTRPSPLLRCGCGLPSSTEWEQPDDPSWGTTS